MILQAIGQRFRVSRGGCWQCVADCRSQLAEALTFSSVTYNGHCLTLARAFGGLAASCSWPPFFSLQALGDR